MISVGTPVSSSCRPYAHRRSQDRHKHSGMRTAWGCPINGIWNAGRLDKAAIDGLVRLRMPAPCGRKDCKSSTGRTECRRSLSARMFVYFRSVGGGHIDSSSLEGVRILMRFVQVVES